MLSLLKATVIGIVNLRYIGIWTWTTLTKEIDANILRSPGTMASKSCSFIASEMFQTPQSYTLLLELLEVRRSNAISSGTRGSNRLAQGA